MPPFRRINILLSRTRGNIWRRRSCTVYVLGKCQQVYAIPMEYEKTAIGTSQEVGQNWTSHTHHLLINLCCQKVYTMKIVDSAPVLHVSFIPGALDDDPFPAILPLIGNVPVHSPLPPNSEETSPMAIYLHGHISSWLIKLPKSSNENNDLPGTPIWIAATHVERLVLAVTPFNHSNN